MRRLIVLAGVVLAVFLIWRLGPGAVRAVLASASWHLFPLVVGAYVLQQTLGTFALWAFGTMERGPGWRKTPLMRLARVRFVGEVINYAMPTGSIGGEPYKLMALGQAEGRRRALDALAAAKFMHIAGIGPFAATVLFRAAGLGLGGEALRAPFQYLGAAFALITVAAWALVLPGFLGRALLGAYYRYRRLMPRPLRGFRVLLQLDRAAGRQVKRAPVRAALAYALYIGMWWAASIEWAAIARVLDIGGSLGLAGGGLFECATIIVAVVPVPAGMGTQEAGKMALAELLGLAAGVGLAMSLVRRAREMLMLAAGAALGLLEWGRRRP